MEREETEETVKKKCIEEKKRNVDTMGIKSCKDMSPFWWQQGTEESEGQEEVISDTKPKVSVTYDVTNFRWQEEPNLTEYGKKDPCTRRDDMAL